MATQELLMDEPALPWVPGRRPGEVGRTLADGTGGLPQAQVFIVPQGQRTEAHFHDVAQFQVILEGKSTFVNHALEGIAVHYTDPNTPYGYFVADTQFKLAVLVPRKRNIFFMDQEENRRLVNHYGRELSAQSKDFSWEVVGEAVDGQAGVRRKVLIGRDDEKGPQAQIWELPASGILRRGVAPFGEFQILVEGSALLGDKEMAPYAMRQVRGDQAPQPIVAGPEGATWLVLTFDEKVQEVRCAA